MRLNLFSKSTGTMARWLSAFLLAIPIFPLNAQPAASSPSYDATREITISGAVSGVLTSGAHGMAWGSHIMIATVSGTVDVSLGRWGLRGQGGLSVRPGQSLEVTGVMMTLGGKEVFLARTVKADGKVYTMRNGRGISVSPQTRERREQRGESL